MKYIKLNNIIKFLGILIISSVLSCKKLIEIPPNLPSQIGQASIFTDSLNTMSAIAGVYTNFKVSSSSTPDLFNGGLSIFTALSGDELMCSSTSPAIEFYTNGIQPRTNSYISILWTNSYKSIYQVNVSIEQINASKGLSTSLKQQLTGELKVVRALYYFNLLNLFGDVPLETTSDYRINAVAPRTSVELVYKQIITDLTDAQQLLKPAYPSAGRARPNLYTATALLAKVYLYRGQWADAATMASQVINSGTYSLVQDLNNVFLSGSQEAIWQLPANGTSTQTIEAVNFLPPNKTTVPTFWLTSTLLNAFEQKDQRKTKWLSVNKVVSVTNAQDTAYYYYPYKYKNLTATATPAEDYMILRLSEQYLIRAEAYARQNRIPEALDDLRKIRNTTRVGLGEYAGPVDQVSVISAVMHERQTELFCEWGNRWFDLKRTQTINTVLGMEKSTWQPYGSLYPIPYSELLLNPFLVQNTGY